MTTSQRASAGLLPETQIISSWDDREDIRVSIVCTTFNHEAYITHAMDGFLRQQGIGAFEIIVHDDASTDGTRAIIERYHHEYPNIIRPILQAENQFSKGGFRPALYAVGFARGEFIALCEADDYWLEPGKLQRQLRALEAHKEINFCIHDSKCVDANGQETSYSFHQRMAVDHVIPFSEIFTCKGQFSPTSAFFVRANVLQDIPPFVLEAPIGDFFIEVLAGMGGGVYYIADKLSVYRRGVPGGWSSTTVGDARKSIEFNHRMLVSLEKLEAFLPMEFSGLVKYKKQNIFFNLANRYLQVGESAKAINFWLKSFSVGRLDSRQLAFVARLAGIGRGK